MTSSGTTGNWKRKSQVSDVLRVHSPVDPTDFSVNIRFRGKQALHPRARAAIADLYAATRTSIRECGWQPPIPQQFEVTAWFNFKNDRGDLDNPYKRVQDAVLDAIKDEFPGIGVNDSRVRRITMHKRNVQREGGEVGVTVEVRKWQPIS